MQTLKVLAAVLLAIVVLLLVQRARIRGGQVPNRPHSVQLP